MIRRLPISSKSLAYVVAIFVPVVIMFGNLLYLFTNVEFYKSLYNETGVYGTFGSIDLINSVAQNLFGYFHNKNALDTNFFSQQAVAHLSDVKDLLSAIRLLFFINASFALLCLLILIVRKKIVQAVRPTIISLSTTLILILLTMIGTFLNFEVYFTKLHTVFFTNDLWLFSEDDTLIKLFPNEFFVQFTATLVRNILFTAGILLLLCLFLQSIIKHKRKSNI